MTADFDVCVVGAGPAGATLAARLAGRGYRVAAVERAQFPRPHVGESLSPGIWPVLRAAGLPSAAIRAGAIRVREAGVCWRTGREERLDLADGATVDRAVFDALLLAHARAAGAVVLAPVRTGRLERAAGGWRVPVGDRVLTARFLADATGRRHRLAGERARTGPPTVAVSARWPADWPHDALQTRVTALPDAWSWAAQLPGGECRVMVFVDPVSIRAEGPRSLFRRQVAATPHGPALLATLPSGCRVEVCDASTYTVAPAVDVDLIRVGEAAFAIDPLSSSGVQTAIQTALAAAATVHTVLSGGDRSAAHEYYADMVRTAVTRHGATAAALYAEHDVYAHRPFWRRRSAAVTTVPAAATGPGPLADLLPHRVRLRSPGALQETACLLGDTIGRRRALVSPELDRPVAFLGGHDIALLVDELAAAPCLAAAVRRWESALPGDRAMRIASWLHDRGMLEPVPADAGSEVPPSSR
ncbi:NAD(P)/FAD-dependent oxidoreductase [Geodermatophilus sp. SYSU D01180]